MENLLPAIPAKRYFTIGEVSELCGVKPYVLRYWEQEFSQLKPMKRRGNRRYYQHHEVLLIRRIRDLLHEQGFTISGARNQLGDNGGGRGAAAIPELVSEQSIMFNESDMLDADGLPPYAPEAASPTTQRPELAAAQLRAELLSIRNLLTV